jgi:DNA-binding HxlR family transcriptional regulator
MKSATASRHRQAPNPYLADCPSRAVLARLGEKWSMLIVNDLADGPKRFGYLLKRIEGISQKMLTQTLRNLERDGLIDRAMLNDRPIQVAYSLTPAGARLLPIVAALKTWTQANYRAIERNQQRYDSENKRRLKRAR